MKELLMIIAVMLMTVGTAWASPKATVDWDSAYGCDSEAYFNRFYELLVQRDKEAAHKVLTLGIITGHCIEFRKGESVYLEDTSFGYKYKIRKPGNPISYWTAGKNLLNVSR